jgi:molybdopterin synthase catalytic subunit
MIAIVEGELPTDDIERAAQTALAGTAGAVVRFIGTVRNHSQGHDIAYLEYEAYRPMAERQMQLIAAEVQERWVCSCAMAHRLGRLEIGEASVVVAVAAPHRREAFEACAFAMDRIKQSVPIWKKEVARDGHWWVEDPIAGPAADGSSINGQGARLA